MNTGQKLLLFILAILIKKDPLPKVDWSKLRPQSLRNLPQPHRYPVYGCSSDASVYQYGKAASSYCQPRKPKFLLPEPFGSMYGLKTNAGIIAVPTEPLHGYIFHEGEWVIAAIPPGG